MISSPMYDILELNTNKIWRITIHMQTNKDEKLCTKYMVEPRNSHSLHIHEKSPLCFRWWLGRKLLFPHLLTWAMSINIISSLDILELNIHKAWIITIQMSRDEDEEYGPIPRINNIHKNIKLVEMSDSFRSLSYCSCYHIYEQEQGLKPDNFKLNIHKTWKSGLLSIFREMEIKSYVMEAWKETFRNQCNQHLSTP